MKSTKLSLVQKRVLAQIAEGRDLVQDSFRIPCSYYFRDNARDKVARSTIDFLFDNHFLQTGERVGVCRAVLLTEHGRNAIQKEISGKAKNQ